MPERRPEFFSGLLWEVVGVKMLSNTFVLHTQLLLTLKVAVLAEVVLSRFWVTGLGQSQAVLEKHPELVIPLFRTIITVM